MGDVSQWPHVSLPFASQVAFHIQTRDCTDFNYCTSIIVRKIPKYESLNIPFILFIFWNMAYRKTVCYIMMSNVYFTVIWNDFVPLQNTRRMKCKNKWLSILQKNYQFILLKWCAVTMIWTLFLWHHTKSKCILMLSLSLSLRHLNNFGIAWSLKMKQNTFCVNWPNLDFNLQNLFLDNEVTKDTKIIITGPISFSAYFFVPSPVHPPLLA